MVGTLLLAVNFADALLHQTLYGLLHGLSRLGAGLEVADPQRLCGFTGRLKGHNSFTLHILLVAEEHLGASLIGLLLDLRDPEFVHS